jgi:hypothetical protein
MKEYKYKTTEEFTHKSREKHGDKYDYSLSEYVNAKTKVKIICPIHGEFEQIPRQHVYGGNCQKCSGVYMDKDYFIKKAKTIHNKKYDYSLVDYVNSLTPVKIICPEHGVFEQRPKDHLLGKKCKKCSGVYMDTEYFIEKANKIHGFIYSYDRTIFKKASSKVILTCEKHGDFEQTPNSHLNGSGCPICRESKGEKNIRNLLIRNNINFIRQHKFKDCINVKPLLFDFYLPEHNICIEFNGEQHYKSFNFFGGNDKLIKTQKNDSIKYDYCKNNNINLLIINNIKSINIILNKLVNQPIF